jgi:hypothetical protein
MTAGRRWVLARRPDGVPSTDDFRLEDVTLPPLQDGQALIRVDHISVDPGMRSRLSGDSYAPALDLGATIESAGVGEVIASRSAKLKEGTRVWGGFGWQTHLQTDGRGVQALGEDEALAGVLLDRLTSHLRGRARGRGRLRGQRNLRPPVREARGEFRRGRSAAEGEGEAARHGAGVVRSLPQHPVGEGKRAGVAGGPVK